MTAIKITGTRNTSEPMTHIMAAPTIRSAVAGLGMLSVMKMTLVVVRKSITTMRIGIIVQANSI